MGIWRSIDDNICKLSLLKIVMASKSFSSDKAWEGKGWALRTWLHLKQVEGQGSNPHSQGDLNQGSAFTAVEPTASHLSAGPCHAQYLPHTVTSEGLAQEVSWLFQPLEQRFGFIGETIQRSRFQQAWRIQADSWAWFCFIQLSIP